MKRRFQPATSAAQQPQRDTHRVSAPVNLLTETEAARHCKYFDRACVNPVRAFQQCARRLGVPVKYVGRTRLYDPAILDAFMERETWTRRHRHAPTVKPALSLVNGQTLSVQKGAGR